jgi:WD40 repeat protein
VIIITPTAYPLEALATSLKKELRDEILSANLVEELTNHPQSLHDYLNRWLKENKPKTKTAHHILIVVDQFEELFTLCQDEAERNAFIDNLLTAANLQAKPSISVVITLRADFYAHCGQYPDLRNALTKNQIYIGPMNAEEIRRAIEGPAHHGGWEFEPGLVELILRDVIKEPGALPLLSHALLETWRRRSGRTLTLQGYATSGGVRGGIARTAESVFNLQLSPTQQPIAKNIFLRLTNLGEETEGTRRRAEREELIPATQDISVVEEVLEKLADARLITLDENSVEVAHEALITEWPTLRNWLIENHEGLRLHRHLTEAAQAWDELDRNPEELYRGARLSQVLEWAENHQSSLSVLETDFLTASKERAEQAENERKAQQERELAAALELARAQEERAEAEKELAESQMQAVTQLRRRAVYLTIALFFVIAMAGIALYLGDRVRQVAITAQENAERAEEESHIAFSRELAAAALSNLDLDPERSILLALNAVDEAQSANLPVPREAEEALHRTVLASRLRMSMDSGFSVDYSPDGSLIAYSGPDSTAIIQEFPSGREVLVLKGHSKDLYGVSVHFSSDGKRLITTSADKTSKVWDVLTGEELLTLRGHTETLTDGIFSPDGTLLATTGNDGTARVWDANTGEQLLRIDLPEPAGIAFDPEGKNLAVADISLFGGSIEIWDVISGQKRLTLAGHEQGTNDVTFNSDGTQLVSVGQDQKIKIWDVSSGEEILTLVDDAPFYTLALSPDKSLIATGGRDGLAKVWDIDSGEILFTLTGHTDIVSFVAFSPDSKYLATSSIDGTTKVWDISPEGISEWLTMAGHSRVVLSTDFSPDGKKIATASWDKTAIMWDAFTGEPLLTIQDFKGELGSIEFSPDQTQLVTSDYSGTVKVWNADTGKLRLSFLAHDIPGDIDADFSPDGKTIGSGGSDGIVRLWDAKSGQLIRSLEGHTNVISRVAFSPDGKLIASASWDGTAKVWQVSSGQLLLTLTTDAGQVRSVDFSPDGKLLATTHENGTAAIWIVSTESQLQEDERPLHKLTGHSNTIFEATFSPDGRQIATSGFDGTIRLWDVDSGRELLVLAENTGGPDMDFSPDGRFLVLAGGDGTARVFILSIDDLIDLAKSRLTRTLTTEECQKYLHQDTCPDNLIEP